MREILDFLHELAMNNNREWFAEHKEAYQRCHAKFVDFTQQYIDRLTTEIEPEMKGLPAKDCIWRIYRDTRFSNDKTPYKGHFGAFPAVKGGKKSDRGGYYIHLQPGACMFAAGIWNPVPDLLKALRGEIYANYEEVEEIMALREWKRYFTDFDTEWMLKTAPKGYAKDFVHIDWLKRKAFTFSTPIAEDVVCAPHFLDTLMDISKAAKPMNDFLNFTFEQYGEFPKPASR